MEKTRKEKDKEFIKNFKIIVGVLLVVVSFYTFSTTYDQYRGEEMYGALTVFITMILIGIGLVYSTQHKIIKENKIKERKFNEEITIKKDLQSKRVKLKNLREKGLLSESEYISKIKDLDNSEVEIQIEKTVEYQELHDLYQSSILTKEEFNSKLITLKKQIKEKEVNLLSNRLDEPNYVFAGSFVDGLSRIRNRDLNYGFVDRAGNIVIEMKYEFAEDFSEGLAPVRLNGKFGFIDEKGKTVISFIYDDAKGFINGRAEVREGQKTYKINQLGLRA